MGLRAGEHRAAGVDRVAGIGGQGDVARVEECEAEVVDALLRPDRRNHLADGVDLDAEALQVEVRERFAELAPAAVARIALGLGVPHRLAHRLDDVAEGRGVRVADAEADHVDALVALRLDPPLELGEHVGRDRFQPLGRGGQSLLLGWCRHMKPED
jgi:hypothetical protein